MFPLNPSRTIAVNASPKGRSGAAPGVAEPTGPQLTPGLIRSFLSARGISEQPLIHAQNFEEFLREKGVTELGRGGEGAVYFLRGHVVKLTGADFTPALLREISHMLYLNPATGADSSMGERQRRDVPALLWIYTLSDGGLSVGMRPFDEGEQGPRGATLHDRLYAGPVLPREQTLRALLRICSTLVYMQKMGVVHHDLKPANIYIPGDPTRDPVVFDLGQALWRRPAWGANWLMHGHNLQYWYNGTYTYMHRLRRRAHICALHIAQREAASEGEREAFQTFVPTDYDDVFAFAYIVRNVVKSRCTKLLSIDKRLLSDYYRALMGLPRAASKATVRLDEKLSLLGRLKGLFGKQAGSAVLPRAQIEPVGNMEAAFAALEPVVRKLMGITDV